MWSGDDDALMLRPVWPDPGAAASPECLRVEDGTLVAVDELGREHRFPLGPGDDSASSLGVVVRAGILQDLIHRNGPPRFLAVFDRLDRLLVMDGRAALWPEDDLDRFASRAGLAFVPFGPVTVRRGGRRRVRLDTSARLVPYVLLVSVIVSIALSVFGAAIGVPVWILTIAVFVLPVVLAMSIGRLVDAGIRRTAVRNARRRTAR